METVTVSRTLDASPDAVRDAIDDVAAFTRAAGFDDVAVDGDRVQLTNQVGLLTMSLAVEVVERDDAALAYEQRDGFFESMTTEYVVESADGGSRVTATTEFALDVAVVGSLLDATVIKRQRRRELEAQMAYLADVTE